MYYCQGHRIGHRPYMRERQLKKDNQKFIASQTWKPSDTNYVPTLHIRMEFGKFSLIQV